MTVEEFFENLVALGFLPDLRDTRGTYRYDIVGAGRWLVIVCDGVVQIEKESEGAATEVDCTLIFDAPDFIDVALARRNAVTALMQGRIVFRGSIHHLPNQLPILESMLPQLGESPTRRVAQTGTHPEAAR